MPGCGQPRHDRRYGVWLAGLALAITTLAVQTGAGADVALRPVAVMRAVPPGDLPPVVVRSIALHPREPVLAAAGDDHRVYLFQLPEGRQTATLSGHRDWVTVVAYSTDGLLYSAGMDGLILRWAPAGTVGAVPFARLPGAVRSLAIDSVQARMAVAVSSGTVFVLSLEDGQVLHELHTPGEAIWALGYSADGEQLAGAGSLGGVYVWRGAGATPTFLGREHRRRGRAVTFAPDGRLVTAGDDGRILLWQVEPAARLVASTQAPSRLFSVCWLGGDTLAAGAADNRIYVWDAQNGGGMRAMAEHQGTVAALAVGSRYLVSAGYDCTIRLWEIGTQSQPPEPSPQEANRGTPQPPRNRR